MENEIRDRAVASAREGNVEESIKVLRPMILDPDQKASALETIAYCFELTKNYSAAKYLYAEARMTCHDSPSLTEGIARVEVEINKKVDDVKRTKPGNKFIVLALLSFLLCLFSFSAALTGFGKEILNLIDLDVSSFDISLVGVGFITGILCIFFFVIWLIHKARYNTTLRHAPGENFLDKGHLKCWQCNLRYLRHLPFCPFCDAPGKKPKPVEVEEPQEGQPTGGPESDELPPPLPDEIPPMPIPDVLPETESVGEDIPPPLP
jgi:hypothetical protein